jgi:hypothetical protein
VDCWLNIRGCGMFLLPKFPPGDCWL